MSNWVRRTVGRNIALKLFSVIFAALLFIAVHQEKKTVAHGLIHAIYRPPMGRVLTTHPPSTLSIGVSGPASRMNSFRIDEIGPINIDLSGAGEGFFAYREKMFQLPPELKIAFIHPDGFQVRFAPLFQRPLPVRVIIQGEVAKGYRVSQREVSPQELIVSGPEQTVRSQKEIRTEPVVVDGAQKTFIQKVHLAQLPAGLTTDRSSPLAVTIVIEPITTELELSAIPVTYADDRGRTAHMTTATIEVMVSGPPHILTRIIRSKVVAKVRGQPEQSGTVKLQPRVEGLPKGVRVERVSPAAIEVIIGPSGTGAGQGKVDSPP